MHQQQEFVGCTKESSCRQAENEEVARRYRKDSKQGLGHRDRAEIQVSMEERDALSRMLGILKGANKMLQFNTDFKGCQEKLMGGECLTHSSRFRKLF